jgi:hypothetical protein
MVNDACIEHFSGVREPVGEEAVRRRCQAIGRMLDMTRAADHGPTTPGEHTDADGFVSYQLDRWIGGGLRQRPFTDERGARQWLQRAVDRLRDQHRQLDLKKHAADFRSRFLTIQSCIGDDTVVLHGQTGVGLDEVRYYLGLTLFAYLSVDVPELISQYMEIFTQQQVEVIHATADRSLSPCALTYGDIACKGRLLHSPAYLRGEFFPRLKRLNDAWHEHGIKCLFHSDGYLMEVMDDLLASGIDGLNPIETVAGMDLAEIRRRCGRRLFLTGGIDISQLMALGTPAQVRATCEQAIAVACPGYFIGSTTELDNGSRLENILAMLETAWKSGPVSGH